MAKLAVLVPRVRTLISLFFRRPLIPFLRLLSWGYARFHRQSLPLLLTPCEIGTKCCGIWCCTQGYECRSGECVNVVSIVGNLGVVSTTH